MMRTKRMKKKRSRSAALLAVACLIIALAPGLARATRHPQPYALIAGTVWAPNDAPLAGVKVRIRPASQHHSKWQLVSSARGEFMQRVPPGPADYVVWCDPLRLKDGRTLAAEPVTVHVYGEERADTGLHLKLETKVK